MLLKKTLYIFISLFLSFVLTGCKDGNLKVTAFNGLPDSKYIELAKAALKNKKPIAVAFIASWCPHCRNYKPIFYEVKEQYSHKVEFIDIDMDDEAGASIVDRFQVMGIPTTAFIRADGSVYKIQVGGIEKNALIEIINSLAKSKKKDKDEPIAPFPIETAKKDVEQKIEKQLNENELPPQELIKQDNEPVESDEEEDKGI